MFGRTAERRSTSDGLDRGPAEVIDGCAKPLSGFRRHKNMSEDDREISAPPVVTIAAAPASDPLASVDSSLVAIGDSEMLPEMLVEGLRQLQQRIAGFTQLSVQEKRSHARAANLDPEFLEHGLQAAAVWRETKLFVKRDGPALRQEQEEIRRWDHLIVELRAFTDGIEASNTKRKHRLGRAILLIYRMLGICMNPCGPEDAYMRPYYENMKRAYLKTQRFRRRTKKEKPAEE